MTHREAAALSDVTGKLQQVRDEIIYMRADAHVAGAHSGEHVAANALFKWAKRLEDILATTPTPQEKPMPDEMSVALDRQCDNMAFVLNHHQLPRQWQEKFERELVEDRKLIQPSIDPDERAREWLRMSGLNDVGQEMVCKALCTDCESGDVPRKDGTDFMHGPKCWNRECRASGLRRLMR